MKKYIFFFLFVLSSAVVFAQQDTTVSRYQSEVHVKYGFGTGDIPIDRVGVNLVGGARLNQYVFLGANVGLDYYFSNGYSFISAPIAAQIKGYIPLSANTSFFGSIDCGYTLSLKKEEIDRADLGVKGFLISPAIGISLQMPRNKSLLFSIGYESQQMKLEYIGQTLDTERFGAFALKLGFGF